MTEKEKLFFEWFDKVEEYATRHDYTINQVVNVRQSWDEGYTAAEKRIIKLLEEQGCDCHNAYCDKLPTAALNSLIALIKRENK